MLILLFSLAVGLSPLAHPLALPVGAPLATLPHVSSCVFMSGLSPRASRFVVLLGVISIQYSHLKPCSSLQAFCRPDDGGDVLRTLCYVLFSNGKSHSTPRQSAQLSRNPSNEPQAFRQVLVACAINGCFSDWRHAILRSVLLGAEREEEYGWGLNGLSVTTRSWFVSRVYFPPMPAPESIHASMSSSEHLFFRSYNSWHQAEGFA